jgi:hypothetical protein
MKNSWLLVILALAALTLAACGGQTNDGLKIGDNAPDFSLQSSDGKEVSLADYRGKQPVLLYFHMALG